MDWAHHRQPRHYQGRSHGYYNQYQPNFNECSSWTLWRSPPPPAAYAKGRPRRWGGVLLGAAAFSVVLAVVLITGLAIYMGALKLDVTQYMMFDGSFRVISGDIFNTSLLDHSSDLFQRKSQIYKLMIESVLRRSDLNPAVKQCSILRFRNGSLVVFFRLILDRRKLPKKFVNIEEHLKALLVQKIPAASPVKSFRIDKTQVLLRRLGEESNHAVPLEIENKNQTLQLHNGVLRKGPPQIVTSNYTTPFSKSKIPKTSVPNIGSVEGTFKLSNPEISKQKHPANFSSDVLQSVYETTTSSHDHQTTEDVDKTFDKALGMNKQSSKIDFYQHSPALKAFLNPRPTIERVTYSKGKVEPTEPMLNYGDTELITLLPYTFQNEEEPWKPMLPENFTRYPERRPFPTEDYNSKGVGIVEVVVNPEDLTSTVPLHSSFPSERLRAEPEVYLKSPYNISELFSFKNQAHSKYENFGPRSDNEMSVVLNAQSDKNEGEFEQYNKVHGGYTKDKDKIKTIGENGSTLFSDTLPEFPIIQQFHDLDSLLRAYNTKSSNPKTSDIPVTLIPARSNLNIKKLIRPRPSQVQVDHAGTYLESVSSESLPELIEDTFKLRVNLVQNKSKPYQIESNKHMIKISNTSKENKTTSTGNTKTLDIQTQVSSELHKENSFNDPNFLSDSLANHGQVDHLLDTEATSHSDIVHYVKISKNGDGEDKADDVYFDYTTETEDKRLEGQVEYVETTSLPKSLVDMSSRSQRNSIVSDKAPNEELPLKFDLQDESKLDFSPPTTKTRNTNSTSGTDKVKVSNEPFFFMNLKDTKLQELLEKIIYNLTTENSTPTFASKSHNSGSVNNSLPLNNFSDYGDITVAQNRKYGQSYSDSKNSLMKNSSFFNVKPDVMLYYLKNPRGNNESSETFKDESKSKNNIKNEQISAVNKTSPNYVLNKNGFLMLTKVFNKVSSSVHSNKESLVKSNLTGNHTISDCLGNINIKCGSGECISSLSRCNNLVDCIDGSDEKNCTCAEFLKAQYLTRKICDGVVDCWDFSDENSCEWCTSNQYVCSNSRVCVDRVRVCNGELDCPNGDDEKNCVSIAPNVSQSDMMNYYSSGILMIRKEGNWGKLCTQNFQTLSSIFKSRWTLEDLGKVVCKTMTFRFFSSIEHINDTFNNEDKQNKFYELLYSREAAQLKSPRLGLTFGDTNCAEKKVVRITCSNLECGVRPQVNPQWGRSKRLSGSRHSRIVGGGNAGPGSWPWLAALYKEGEFQCGATLISDRWLLSAGHCFYHSLDDYWVARLGALRRGTNLPSPYEQLRVVSRILLHPNYIDAGFINDISLLQMESPVSLTNYVRPICLPQTNAVLQDGKMCTVIGWGQLFEVGRIFPDTLQEVQLPVISTTECRKRTLFLPLYKVTENMFCAGYDRGGRDACLGDSGGPLMCQENDGRWSLMGVTSNGYGCARANRPGVYTKVANYVSWVHSSMSNKGVIVSTDKHPKGRNISCHGHRCPLGECLPPARICNGFMECSDGSDEKDCW